jgi:hypothetical protein
MKITYVEVGWDSIFFNFFGNCRALFEGETLSVSSSYISQDFLFIVKFMDPERTDAFENWRDWSVSEFKKAREFVYEESLGGTGRSREFFDPARNVKIQLEINEA